MAESHLKAFEEFGVDGISLFSDVGILAEAMGSTFHFGEDDVPSLDRPILEEGDDPSRLPLPAPDRGRLPVIINAASTCHGEVGDIVPVFAFVPGPFTTAAMLRGLEDFLSDLVLAPRNAEAVLHIASRAAISFFDALMMAGALPVIVEPLASGSVISDDMFRTFALDPIRKQIDYLHRFDMDVVLHVCGDTAAEIASLAETGADLLSLDGITLPSATGAVGGQCRLVGNVSPAILLHGTPGDVRGAVENAIREGRDNPKGFVVSTGCEIPPVSPGENIQAFVDTVREIGGG
jgi:uroporphyrinogen decarboxylase